MKKGVLVFVCSHPDGPEVLAGGTMAKHVKAGWDVYQVILSYGERANPNYPTEELKKLREQEQRKAAKIEGCKDVFFLGLPDTEIQASKETKLVIMDYIRKLKPDVIITTNINTRHPDLRETHITCVDAAFMATLPAIKTNLPPHEPRCVYVTDIPGWTSGFNPDTYIDITDVMEIKLQALECHKTMYEAAPYYGKERWLEDYKSLSRHWGRHCGVEYAEAFQTWWMPHLAKIAIDYFPTK